jgi:hypothetical protein
VAAQLLCLGLADYSMLLGMQLNPFALSEVYSANFLENAAELCFIMVVSQVSTQ